MTTQAYREIGRLIFYTLLGSKTVSKFFEIFLRKGLGFLKKMLRLRIEEQKPSFRFPRSSLKIEYTFIRYVPIRRRNPKPNEDAPRPACP
jgi:hypothetical protein